MSDDVRSGRAAVDRSRPPEPGRVRPFELPPPEARALDNGLALKLLQVGRLPLATLTLVLDAGEAAVGQEAAGLAVLTGEALEGGTERLGPHELARSLEGLGADLVVRTGWDATTIGLTVLPERLDEALDLLAEVARRPVFPDTEVARVRDQREAALRQRAMDPGQVADDEATRRIFREGSAYGRPLAGTPDAVARMEASWAQDFANRCYGPMGGGLAAVGDFDPDRLARRVDEHFGDWEATGFARGGADAEPGARHRRVVLVDRPGAVQSEVRMGHVGVARSSPDYFPLLLFNTVLGGAFSSRLNLKLREERGFTYGVCSRIAFRRAPGPFSVGAAVGTEQTPQAVADALGELEALLENGPTDDEVEAARDYLSGTFPLRFETTAQAAARLGELVIYDLDDDFHTRYRDRIASVSRGDVHEAGRRTVRPDELLVLVVGDAETLRVPMEELDVGPVEVVRPLGGGVEEG